jgi:hypothetical protein
MEKKIIISFKNEKTKVNSNEVIYLEPHSKWQMQNSSLSLSDSHLLNTIAVSPRSGSLFSIWGHLKGLVVAK